MSGFQKVFTDNEGLLKIIGQHEANWHLLDCSRDHRSTSQNPMPYFRPHKNLLHCVALNPERIIMAGASFREIAGGPVFYDESGDLDRYGKVLNLGMSTHIDYRHRGLARAIYAELFQRARNGNAILEMSEFRGDGQTCLTRVVPETHRNYPEVPVVYADISEYAVTASRPYQLLKGPDGAFKIAYS